MASMSELKIMFSTGKKPTGADFARLIEGAEGPTGKDGLNGKDGLPGRDGVDGSGAITSVNGKTGVISGLAEQSSVNELTTQLADTVKQVNGVTPVNGIVTIPVPEIDTSKLATKSELQAVASGSPKGTYATVTALQTAHPTGNVNVYVVTADGKWYYWSGLTWIAGGVYQSTGIADDSVTYNQTSFLKAQYINLIDKTKLADGYIDAAGLPNSSTAAKHTDYIPVEYGKTYKTKINTTGIWRSNSYSGSKVGIAKIDMVNGEFTITDPNVKFIRLVFYPVASDDMDLMMVEGTVYPTTYKPYELSLKITDPLFSTLIENEIDKKPVTFNNIDPAFIAGQEKIEKYHIEGKYGGTSDRGIWSSFWFDTNGSTFKVGDKVTVSFDFQTLNDNLVGQPLKIWSGVAPFSASHGNWWNPSIVKAPAIVKAKIYNVSHTFTITDAQLTNAQQADYKYRVCPVPFMINDTTTDYFVWNFKMTVAGVDYTKVVNIGAVSGVSDVSKFKSRKLITIEPNKILTSNYADEASLALSNLQSSLDKVKSKYDGKTIRTFGDSITEGTEGGYVQYITNLLNANVINHGASGSVAARIVGTMTHIKSRNEFSPVSTPDYTNTSAVTIMCGANDGSFGSLASIPYTTGQSVDSIPFTVNGVLIDTEDKYWNLFANDYFGNIALCIEYVKYKNPSIKIYLITPPHNDRSAWAKMPEVRNHVLSIGALYSVPVIDAQVNAGLDKKHLYKYSYDLTHLNALGNKLWGEYVAEQMKNN